MPARGTSPHAGSTSSIRCNNVLGFPGFFRGALDVRAREINEDMKMAAARAIARLAEPISEECIIPSPLDRRVVPRVDEAVARAAERIGLLG